MQFQNMNNVNLQIKMYEDLIEKYSNIKLIESHSELWGVVNINQMKLVDIESKISISNVIIESLNKLNNIDKCINDINICNNNILKYNSTLNDINDSISKIEVIIHGADRINKIQRYVELINIIETNSIDISNIDERISNINPLVTKLSKLVAIETELNKYYHNTKQAQNNIELNEQQYSTLQNNIEAIENNINIISSVIKNQHEISMINNYILINNQIKSIEIDVVNINNNIEGLDLKYNLRKCQECGGIGYVHNH